MKTFNLKSKFYSTTVLRPKTMPFLYEKEYSFLNILTPWTEGIDLKTISDEIYNSFCNMYEDQDTTRLFEYSDSLSTVENHLRSALKQINNKFLRKGTDFGCMEALSLVKVKKHIYIAQVGQPHILLLENKQVTPVSITTDYCFDYRQNNTIPFPKELIGCRKNINLRSIQIPISEAEDEKILFLSRSWVPSSLFQTKNHDIHNLSQSICLDQSTVPFWVGMLSFKPR